MDPITQGTLGAAAALAVFGGDRRLPPRVTAWLGALSGMAADLDVLIRSDEDPLLAILFHRHFSHSLAFVPVGAAVALLPWLLLPSVRRNLRLAYGISFIGYLTHAPLDCCTTYGTLFFWPFSDYRVSLSWISIVDPVYTLPLLAFVIVAARRRAARLARLGLLLSTLYIGLGAVQKARALGVQERLAESRGHAPVRRDMVTTFMNQVVWRSLYEVNGRIYVDRIRVPYFGRVCVTDGASMPVSPPTAPNAGPTVRRAENLMRWFSSGWVASPPSDPALLGDVRYSAEPEGLEPFWAVRSHLAEDRAEWVSTGVERSINAKKLGELLFSVPPASRCE